MNVFTWIIPTKLERYRSSVTPIFRPYRKLRTTTFFLSSGLYRKETSTIRHGIGDEGKVRYGHPPTWSVSLNPELCFMPSLINYNHTVIPISGLPSGHMLGLLW